MNESVATAVDPPPLVEASRPRLPPGTIATAVEWLFGSVAAFLFWELLCTPRYCPHGCDYRPHPVEVAQFQVHKYDVEAYPAWAAMHRGRACPMTLAELANYYGQEVLPAFGLRVPQPFLDPWGRPYQLRCTGQRAFAWSLGYDGVPDTVDDISSDWKRHDR